MAQGEDPEWLIWCMRLKLEHTKIFHQLSSLAEASSRIDILAAKVADSIAGDDQVQAEYNILKDRIASLEEDSKQHYLISPPNVQAIDELQTENEALKDRVLRLEQDANQQDQINAVSSQAKATLEQKFAILKMEYISVTDAVETMQKTALVERQGQRRELKEMKAQMEAFLAGTSQRNSHPAREDSNHLTGLFPDPSRPRRTMSEATTADESVRLDAPKETQCLDTKRVSPQFVEATQLHTQYLDSTQLNMTDPISNVTVQGSSSLEQYIRQGDIAITEGIYRYEAQAVYKLVNGLNDKYRQHLLKERLDNDGWTWSNAKKEIHRLAKEAERLRKRRRILPADFDDQL